MAWDSLLIKTSPAFGLGTGAFSSTFSTSLGLPRAVWYQAIEDRRSDLGRQIGVSNAVDSLRQVDGALDMVRKVSYRREFSLYSKG
jgi:hypothetical protein